MSEKKTTLKIVLEVEAGGEGGGRQEFEQKSVIIGSGPAANLRLDDPGVSSIHAILKPAEDDSSALISDLGSEEGTFVNGEEIRREAALSRGDTITLGNVDIFVVAIGEEEVETKTEKAPAGKKKETPAVESAQEKEPTPVQRPPRRPPSRPPARPPQPALAGGHTEVIRRREIPKRAELGGVASGMNFFQRELRPEEQPNAEQKLLEVKVSWGPVALETYLFADDREITIGDTPDASIRITTDRLGGEKVTLVSPSRRDGCTINVGAGMEIEARRDGQALDLDSLPSSGATRTYNMGLHDRCLVQMGQLGFVIQYVVPAQSVFNAGRQGSDYRMTRWFLSFLVLALGLWVIIQITPEAQVEASEYLKNPARFAQLIMPSQKAEKKKTFEEIKKKKEEKVKVEDTGKWKRVKTKSRTKNASNVPREVKEKQDRKIATSAGILGLLKGRGGGTGDNASSVFGGSAMASLDQNLAGLRSSGMGDSSGFGGLGVRGGGLGGGGGGLGLGGLGTSGYGRGSGSGYGSVKIGRRGKHAVRVVRGRSKVVGGLSQQVVGRYIKRYWAQFKYCYERQLTKDPNLYGKITITFTIAGNGRVSDSTVIQSTMHNANVEECVLRVVRRIRFPAPKGGGEVIVTYPFMFTTAG